MPLDEGITSETLAKEFTNVSGADIKDIIFMAAVTALERCENEKAHIEDEVCDEEPNIELFQHNEKNHDEEEDEVREEAEDIDNKIYVDAEKIINDDDIEAEYEAAVTVEENEETEEASKEEEDDSNQFVTMEDFRTAYNDIKNRYRNN